MPGVAARVPGLYPHRALRRIPLAFLMLLLCWPASARSEPLFAAPSLVFDAGGPPTSVAVADFDGDGRPDVVASSYSYSFSILLGNGDGTLGAASLIGAEGSAHVVTADLDRDGRPDVVTTNGDSILVRLGNGDGTFQPRTAYGTLGPSPIPNVAIGDLNADGIPDLVAASGAISVLLGNGDGTFRSRTDFEAFAAGSAAIADLDGNGRMDVVATNSSNEPNQDYPFSVAVWVLLGNGDGTLGPAAGFGEGYYPYSVKIADFDEDGNPDLVFTNTQERSTSVSVLMGNGDGAFGAQRNLPTGADPVRLDIGDLDGDGRLDLAVANAGFDPDFDSNTVSVLMGNGDGTFRTMPERNVGNEDPNAVAIADMNGDGRQDLVTNGGLASGGGTISVLLGNGDGTFGIPEPATGGSPASVAIGDLDRDGRQDLAVANWCPCSGANSVSVLLGIGDGTFAARMDFGTGTSPRSLAIGDLDADGNADLAVANQGSNTVSVLRGNGDGSFAPRADFSVGSRPGAVAIADLDADERPDIAVANDGSDTISLLLGNGDGTFTRGTDLATGGDPNWVSIADLNGDGRQDLVVAAYHQFWVTVFLGYGDGTFAAGTNWSVGRGTLSVAIADFDGDKRADMAVGHFDTPDGRTVSVLLGNGDGTFGVAADLVAGNGPYSIVAADFNADGRPDIAVPNYDLGGNVSVLLGNGDGTFAPRIRFGVGRHPLSIASADLNGDGRPDLAAANTVSNSISILLGSAEAPTSVVRPDAPADTRLTLDGFRPNPAFSGAAVAFALADHSPATIEVLDVAGRRVLRRDVGELGPGHHVIRLESADRLSPGLYLVSLRQAGRTRFARGVVVR